MKVYTIILYGNLEGKVENNLRLVKKNGKWKSNLFLHYSFHDAMK
jgi:hypothetical protein